MGRSSKPRAVAGSGGPRASAARGCQRSRCPMPELSVVDHQRRKLLSIGRHARGATASTDAVGPPSPPDGCNPGRWTTPSRITLSYYESWNLVDVGPETRARGREAERASTWSSNSRRQGSYADRDVPQGCIAVADSVSGSDTPGAAQRRVGRQALPGRERRVVRPGGFEPPTCGLRVHCSAIELEAPDDSSRPPWGWCQPKSTAGDADRPATEW